MPIPDPSGEDKQAYVSRVIAMLIKEGKPKDQAAAIAYDKWEKAHKSFAPRIGLAPYTITFKEIE